MKLCRLVNSKVYKFFDLTDKEKLFWILNCEDIEIMNALGSFLRDNLP